MSRLRTLYSKKQDIQMDILLFCVFIAVVVVCLWKFLSDCRTATTLYPNEKFGFLDVSPIIFLDCLSAYFMLGVIIRHTAIRERKRYFYYESVVFLLLLSMWLISNFYSANLTWSAYPFFHNPALPPFILSVICLLIPLFDWHEKEKQQAGSKLILNAIETKIAGISINKGSGFLGIWNRFRIFCFKHRNIIIDIFAFFIFLYETLTVYHTLIFDCNFAHEIYPDQDFGSVHLYFANIMVILSTYFMLSLVIRHFSYGKVKLCYYLSVALLLLAPLWLIPKFHSDNLTWAAYHRFMNPSIVPLLISIIFLLFPLYEGLIATED